MKCDISKGVFVHMQTAGAQISLCINAVWLGLKWPLQNYCFLQNVLKLFWQIGNNLSTESPMWNPVKIAPAVSEKKTFKNYTILYMYIAQGQGQITPRGQNVDNN